jgi:hypothetical protein
MGKKQKLSERGYAANIRVNHLLFIFGIISA